MMILNLVTKCEGNDMQSNGCVMTRWYPHRLNLSLLIYNLYDNNETKIGEDWFGWRLLVQ